MRADWSLRFWPSLRNAAWRRAAAAEAALGAALEVRVRPRAVGFKVTAAAMAPLKSRFLIEGLADLPAEAITSLYTYGDMADIAAHGEDLQATRLYHWLRAALAAGRPVQGRGILFDSDQKIIDYCRTNLDLFRSLQRNGYNYSGPDEICFGITANGEIRHMRRGTHRMTAAHILELPSVSGRITHVDRAFAERVVGRKDPGSAATIERLGQAIQEVTRQTLA